MTEKENKKVELPKDPESFDTSIDVIGRPGLLWIAALSGVGFLSFIWAIFGSIKIEETTPSIFLFKSTVASARSEAQQATLNKYFVKVGDSVEKGDILAKLDVNDRIEQLKLAKDILNFEKETIESNIKTNKELLTVVSKRILSAKDLLNKKFITADVYNDMLEKKLTLANQLKQSYSALSKAKSDFNIAKNNLDRESNIISPFEGKVISLTSSAGQSISAGADLVQIARGESEGLRHIAFIPVTKGKKVKVGMGALVTPSNVSRSAFGGIKGKITYVSPFPVSESRIMSVVGNEAIVQKFTNGPVLELNVKLINDQKTITGYEWTSGNGPDINISPGLLSTTYIVTQVKRPISYALPMIRDVVFGKPVDEINKNKK